MKISALPSTSRGEETETPLSLNVLICGTERSHGVAGAADCHTAVAKCKGGNTRKLLSHECFITREMLKNHGCYESSVCLPWYTDVRDPGTWVPFDTFDTVSIALFSAISTLTSPHTMNRKHVSGLLLPRCTQAL